MNNDEKFQLSTVQGLVTVHQHLICHNYFWVFLIGFHFYFLVDVHWHITIYLLQCSGIEV